MSIGAALPKVVLLAGFPNSGTTIVSYILGQHPAVFASGELYGFPARQLKPGKVCSCGAAAAACPFWSAVVKDLGRLGNAPNASKLPALYRIISRLSGRPYVLDVAHDVRAFRTIRGLDGIDLNLVHLTRRRSAVLRSRLSLNHRNGEIHPYTLRYVSKAVRHLRRLQVYQWTVAACLADGIGAIQVSYEDLCRAARRPLARIGALMGLDFETVADRLEAGAPLALPEHMIRGNDRLRAEPIVHVAVR